MTILTGGVTPSPTATLPQLPTRLPGPERLAWRAVQTAVFLLGLGIVTALLLWPRVGLTALWNVLVPVAPALLVLAPGLWRNVCPLASAALWSRHMDLSARRRLSTQAQGWLSLAGLLLLIFIVPLRHIGLDTNGPVTGAILVCVGLLSISMGTLFEWKSGWCSGLCPVHPVEKLYGQRPAVTLRNAHCTECQRCTTVCPDSTQHMNPLCAPPTTGHRLTATVLIGGFPGYVWGWFQVSDAVGHDFGSIAQAYALPLAGLFTTLILYVALRDIVQPRHRDLLARCFAAAAVGCYYWYRLPMLMGFGAFPGEGVLIDLREVLPAWAPLALQVGTTALLVWWLVVRPALRRSWTMRPPYAPGVSKAADRRAAAVPTLAPSAGQVGNLASDLAGNASRS